jgi:membrane associated rhomboid family serine protease
MKNNFLGALRIPLYIILLLWVIHLFSLTTGIRFGSYGVYPRTMVGLRGIFISPFIHGSLHHLFSNSIPLLVLMFVILFFYKRVAFSSIMLIYFLTGLGVWAFGRSHVFHIGASGVVYGLVAFVFWTGIFRRNLKSVVLALMVTVLYSSYFLGVLPNQEGISWEIHLIGGIVGILVAFLFKNSIEMDEKKRDPWADEDESTEYFLPRDVFEKTKEERRREELGY